jgi:hypothetical protein
MPILLAAIATFVTDFATDFRPLDRDSFYFFAIDYSIISFLCTLDMCSVVRQSLFHGHTDANPTPCGILSDL